MSRLLPRAARAGPSIDPYFLVLERGPVLGVVVEPHVELVRVVLHLPHREEPVLQRVERVLHEVVQGRVLLVGRDDHDVDPPQARAVDEQGGAGVAGIRADTAAVDPELAGHPQAVVAVAQVSDAV
ncbi:MAG: hypothetical protein JRI25_17370, partial [Deltaproteobacteria bacterium]|nr:hypothetical protein [Deltaproteobacteria bacterium]